MQTWVTVAHWFLQNEHRLQCLLQEETSVARVKVFIEQCFADFTLEVGTQQNIHYGVCAHWDELLSQNFGQQWMQQPLQMIYFGEYTAGEGFFQRLQQQLVDPQAHRHSLVIYYLVLQLGFKGKYLVADHLGLVQLKQQLQQLMQSWGKDLSSQTLMPVSSVKKKFDKNYVYYALLLMFCLGWLCFKMVSLYQSSEFKQHVDTLHLVERKTV